MFIYLDFLDLTLYLWQLRVTFKTSLAAQWLRLHVSTARGTSLISTRHAAWQKKKKKVSFYLQMWRVPLSFERFTSCFRKTERKVKVCLLLWPFLNLLLKIINMPLWHILG